MGSNSLVLCLLYRSPSQEPEQFNLFKSKLEENIRNVQDHSPTVAVFWGILMSGTRIGGLVISQIQRGKKLVNLPIFTVYINSLIGLLIFFQILPLALI